MLSHTIKTVIAVWHCKRISRLSCRRWMCTFFQWQMSIITKRYSLSNLEIFHFMFSPQTRQKMLNCFFFFFAKSIISTLSGNRISSILKKSPPPHINNSIVALLHLFLFFFLLFIKYSISQEPIDFFSLPIYSFVSSLFFSSFFWYYYLKETQWCTGRLGDMKIQSNSISFSRQSVSLSISFPCWSCLSDKVLLLLLPTRVLHSLLP